MVWRAHGVVLEDWIRDASCYVSFEEDNEETQKELDRLIEHERAHKVRHGSGCLVGREAKLTKLACLVKPRAQEIKSDWRWARGDWG